MLMKRTKIRNYKITIFSIGTRNVVDGSLMGYAVHISVVSPIEKRFPVLCAKLKLTPSQADKSLSGYEWREAGWLLTWGKDDLGGLAKKIIAEDVDVIVFERGRKSWRQFIESSPK